MLVAACLAALVLPPVLLAADDAPRVVPGEILVVVERGPGVLSGASAEAEALALGELARTAGARPRAVQALGRGASRRAGAFLLRFDDGVDLAAAAALLGREPGVAYAGPNHVLRLEAIPNDPIYPQQSPLTDSRVPQAWDRSRGAGILIAVVDTGVDLDHPDLRDRLAVNAAERDGAPGVDDDGNGYVDDVHGFDFTDAPGLPGRGDYLDRDGDPEDDYGHGTAVAGVACATWNNGMGIAGVAPEAELLALRAGLLTTLPFLPAILEEDDAAAAILYAADRGAQVINLSFGDVVRAPVIEAAIRYAKEKGALVVAAAGNEGNDLAFYPASLPGVLSVGASHGRTRVGFSTFGVDLDLLAPGVEIHTTTLGGGYGEGGGTSFSAPMAAGAAALVWSLNPEWTADQVAARLLVTAWGSTSGWSPETGYGFLDAAAATEPADPPPVVQITGLRALHPNSIANPEVAVEGTVAHPALATWDLDAEAATAAALVRGAGNQVVNAALAPWMRDPAGPAVLRLRAGVPGYPVLQDRMRVEATGYAVENPRVEALVEDARTWGVLVTWTSPLPQQGAALVSSGLVASRRFAEEGSVGRHHAVRVRDVPPGVGAVVFPMVRGPDWFYYPALDEPLPVAIPPVVERSHPVIAEVPAGTPFGRTLDLNGNDVPEVILEAPPGAAAYGPVRAYEWSRGTEFVRVGASDAVVGIPRAAGDSDGDGLPEIVAYRVDAWSLYEACAPGEFPECSVFQAAAGIPVAVVGGRGLLVVTGARVQLLEAASAYTQGPSATHPGNVNFATGPGEPALADVDGDGRMEALLLDRDGALVQIELGPELAVESVSPGGGVPAGGPFLDGDAVLTAEREPVRVEFEGDLNRRLVRVRRWTRDGAGWAASDSVAFAETGDGGMVRFHRGMETTVSRGGCVDGLGPGLAWSGRLGDVAGGDAAVALQVEAYSATWIGTADGAPGTLIAWGDPDGPRVGELRVVSVQEDESGLTLVLAWQGCPGAELWRHTAGGDRRPVEGGGGVATDQVAWHEDVTYTLESQDCRVVSWFVRGNPVGMPRVSRDGGNVAVELEVPLAPGLPLPRFTTLSGRPAPVDASQVEVLNGGRRVLVGFPERRPTDIRIENGWTADGLPIGGHTGWTATLPPLPDPPVIASVVYDAAALELRAEIQGTIPETSCASPFLIEPEGTRPEYRLEDATAILTLTQPLAPGRYTLMFSSTCISVEIGLGGSRDFLVGTVAYPNPVVGGQPLTLANLPGPAQVRLLDLSGREVHSWGVPAGTSRLDLGVAPGLYMLRIESDQGVTVEKIAVRR